MPRNSLRPAAQFPPDPAHTTRCACLVAHLFPRAGTMDRRWSGSHTSAGYRIDAPRGMVENARQAPSS